MSQHPLLVAPLCSGSKPKFFTPIAKKEKTLKELAPKWYFILNDDLMFATIRENDGRAPLLKNIEDDCSEQLDLCEPHSCLVAEAYSFDDYYCMPESPGYCLDCTKYSLILFNVLISARNFDRANIAMIIVANNFVDHFTKRHLK